MIHLQDFVSLNDHSLSMVHALSESLACALGYHLYKKRRQQEGDVITVRSRHWIMLAATIGSLLGSRAPGLMEWNEVLTPGLCSTRKTIVGGLLGAWLSVELAKALLRVRVSTGDLFVLPLVLAMGVGRIGCFLAGRVDGTYGLSTSLPWAVDFGDGIGRHPTQIYELFFLAGLFILLQSRRFYSLKNGMRFRVFLASYLAFRVLIDFWKPLIRFHQLSATQWVALLGLGILFTSGVYSYARSRLYILRHGDKHLFALSPQGRSENSV